MIFDKRELIKAIIGSDFFGLTLLTIVMAACLSYRHDTYEYETVPVVVQDIFVEPSTITEGYYIPEKYYLVIENDNYQYAWTIQGKEAYDQYKNRIGETIEAGVKVYNKTIDLCKLEGQEVPDDQVNTTYKGSPLR